MKKSLFAVALLSFALGLTTRSAQAVLSFDDDVTSDVIFGTGNANGSWTIDRNLGVEVGLRAKLRFDGANQPQNTFNSDGAGTYKFDAGLPPTGFGFASGSPSTATWNFEWSINSNHDGSSGSMLNDLTYVIRMDFDPSPGTNFLQFDPVNVPLADHPIGNNSTVNGGGTSAATPLDYATLIDTNNLVQNSWNMEFFDDGGAFFFSGAASGTYEFELVAFDGATPVASTAITVSAVPEPSAFLFGGLVCTALGVSYTRKRKQN